MDGLGESRNLKRKRGCGCAIASSSSSVDRLSSLPDEIIHHIFSCLPTRNLFESSVLSKRWTNLWRCASSLYFDMDDFISYSDFEKFVKFVLRLRDPSDIQQFRLYRDCPFPPNSAYLIYKCLANAVKHNVKVLHLSVKIERVAHQEKYFTLPLSLLTCGSLIELKLDFNDSLADIIPTSLSLSHLKILNMNSVTFPSNEESTHEAAFFSACPMLETLILQDCVVNDYVLVSIDSLQLKNLTIADGFRGSRSMGPCTVNINAPNLVRLILVLQQSPDDRYLLKVPSILNAFVHLDSSWRTLTSQLEILRAISNAHAIGLSCFDIEEHLLGELSFPFPQLKSMELLWVGMSTNAWIVTCLKHSSNIESLNIRFSQAILPEDLIRKIDLGGSLSMLHNLKSVVIEDFQGYPNQIELVQFLLEKAVVLEKITIYSLSVRKDSPKEEQLKKFREKLYTYRQAAPNARIAFQLRNSPD